MRWGAPGRARIAAPVALVLAGVLALGGCSDPRPATRVPPPSSALPRSSQSAPSPSTTPASLPVTVPDASTSAPPATSGGPDTTGAPGGVAPSGFDTVAATAIAPDGTVCALCLWRADESLERARGLMGVTALGGADGMAFVYAEPVDNAFYMYGTPMPLSIAFVDAQGVVISTTDMEPCRSSSPDACPRYRAVGPFVLAIEVPQGGLDELGLVVGATVTLGAPCPLDTA